MEKNRRHFLRDLGLGLSAMVFAPKIIKPTFRDTLRFNRINTEVLNPAWIEAPYEVSVFTLHQGQWNIQVVRCRNDAPEGSFRFAPAMNHDEFNNLVHKHDGLTIKDPCPMRLAWDKTYIPPYIET